MFIPICKYRYGDPLMIPLPQQAVSVYAGQVLIQNGQPGVLHCDVPFNMPGQANHLGSISLGHDVYGGIVAAGQVFLPGDRVYLDPILEAAYLAAVLAGTALPQGCFTHAAANNVYMGYVVTANFTDESDGTTRVDFLMDEASRAA